MDEELNGLSNQEVKKQKALGLSNEVIDTYTPSTPRILLRNIFSLINIILIPLLVTLYYFDLRTEVLAFGVFAVINTIISAYEELRIKHKVDELKSQFQQTARVIREGKESVVPVSQIVQGDFVRAKEGEGIIADGKVIFANYLQIDESMLTGESNYIAKEKGEAILASSYVITGECVYTVEKVGKGNYLNQLGSSALKYKEKKSSIQKKGDKLILFLVVSAIVLSAANFYLTRTSGISIEDRILSLTTIIVLIIPQTLIFLFTLAFAISITKLHNKGILVQKGGSIEDLSNIDTICFDKTGTITTNEMHITDVKYFNATENDFAPFYNSVKVQIVSINKTQALLNERFATADLVEVKDFDQIPFTSKLKYSALTGKVNDTNTTLIFGAYGVLTNSIAENLRPQIEEMVKHEEGKGNRVLVGVLHKSSEDFTDFKEEVLTITTDQAVVISIEEELNPGIKEIFQDLAAQGINFKIISGDSLTSVTKVLQKVGVDSSKAVDLSATDDSTAELALSHNIFTRARPEDKLVIINALKNQGHKVAMVGDGINDVLSIKAADVSIAMESGSKITRDVADIVLLQNDYAKIPTIFFEGENILFNLKLSTKLFLFKSLMAIFFGIYFTLIRDRLPLHPASTLIFSFIGSSAPSYVIVFTRQSVKKARGFFDEVLRDALPQSLIATAILIGFYHILKNQFYDYLQINSSMVLLIASVSILYSLILIARAKKISGLVTAAGAYVVLMYIAIMQTLLPVTLYDKDEERLAIFGLIIIGAVGLFFIVHSVFKLNTLKKRLAFTVGTLLFLPVALYFPCNTYYHVTRVQGNLFGYIALFSIVISLAIIVSSTLLNRTITLDKSTN